MNTREMFKNLGYDCSTYEWEIYYEKRFPDTIYQICFDLTNETFYCCEYGHILSDESSLDIDMPTFKAICQQIKELGWVAE